MSRATLILILLVVIVIAGFVWLSRGGTSVAPHRIEKVVTLEGAADGSK